jgi:tetratricopeptide (TPR) repeat protein
MTVGKQRGSRWQDRDLFGKTLEIARDCQRLAEPGEVVITEDTKRLVQESFELQGLAPQNLRTAGESVQTYQVCGESSAPSRLEWLAQTQRLTTFTGREAELRQLQNYHEEMLQGMGQAVFVHGEAGSGKSRLIWEFKQQVLGEPRSGMMNTFQPVQWLTSRCLPHFEQTSLYPMIGLLEQLLGFQANDSMETRQEKLNGMLAWYEMKRPFSIWLLSLLLGLPLSEPAPETTTKAQREQMRELFMTLLQKRAAEQPLVLAVEDLHWCDPSSIDWLGHVVGSVTAVPCLILLTTRPDSHPGWLANKEIQSKLHQLALKPLPSEQVAQMVSSLADDNMLDEETRQYIITQTDGIPLFVEELTKTLLEQAVDKTAANGPAKIPTTLLDSLMTRLDRLGAAKETAQWAAVLGREFSYSILQACSEWDEHRLQNDLAQLIEAELVAPAREPSLAIPPAAWYAFKHALMQETAYASLLKQTRQLYHQQAAEVLEMHFPQIAETRPETLAQHYASAGMPAQAAGFWLQAGEHAAAQGATLEARTFFDRALQGIEPADNERRWQALLGRERVLDARGERTEQEADLRAMLALAEEFGDATWRFQVYMRQTSFAAMKGDYRAALPLAEAAVTAARKTGSVPSLLRALAYSTQTLLFMREMGPARQGVEEILTYVESLENDSIPAPALTVAAQYYMEAGDLAQSVKFQSRSAEIIRSTSSHDALEASIRGNLGLIYAMLGLYAQARTSLEAGGYLAKEIGDRRLYATIMCHLGHVHGRSGDNVVARQMEEQALKTLAELGDAYGEATCLTYLGYLFEENGELTLAANYLARARTGYAAIGLEADKFEAQAIEARVTLALGQYETAEQLAVEVWKYLSEQGSEGFSWSSLAYVCVADVLEAVQIPNISLLHEVILAGYHDLMQRAEKISDADWRQSFLENVTENRVVVERWEKMVESCTAIL